MKHAKEYNELDVKNMFEKNKGVLTKKYFRPRKVFLKPWGVIQRKKGATMMIPVGKERQINLNHFDGSGSLGNGLTTRVPFLLLFSLCYWAIKKRTRNDVTLGNTIVLKADKKRTHLITSKEGTCLY